MIAEGGYIDFAARFLVGADLSWAVGLLATFDQRTVEERLTR